MTQTLVIEPNQLLVEGPSDVVYLTVMSEVVREAGGTPLDPNWTITPVGGLDKVPSFVSLLGSSDLSIAVLMDVAGGGNPRIAQLVSRGLLDKGRLVYLTEFTNTSEADIEDGTLLDQIDDEPGTGLKPCSSASTPSYDVHLAGVALGSAAPRVSDA